ncbi:hypothetical protein BC835DRAFT_1310282 [Cytidiella melzeri]|nr:hypothetical protein BC835DRAFT_1310282 [Cytidiella melzeri]
MFSSLISTISSALGYNSTPHTKTRPHPLDSYLDDVNYQPPNFDIDDYRPLKVRCIGAGHSGILCAMRFRQNIPNLDFKIYEKQGGVGGTWYANRYPKCGIIR